MYEESLITNTKLPSDLIKDVEEVGRNIEHQKGVFTVLITLGIHKILNPNQDIRYHQDNMVNGFSGRSIDTKHITPTLKELNLPSMAESGWLTRSLEQPYPYDEKYNGKIAKLKSQFLSIVARFQKKPEIIPDVILTLLTFAVDIRERNKVVISPIKNPDKISIEKVMDVISEFLAINFKMPGGSKLPVLVFHSIYSVLINEMKRYDGCVLGKLGSHTSADLRSKASGDIEVFKDKKLIEALEIKYDVEINNHIVSRAIEKIHKNNPKRYYILSTANIKQDDFSTIISKIHQLHVEHGCQLIINGILPTIKYYLRLIEDVADFVDIFSKKITSDTELKIEHKTQWQRIHNDTFNS